MKDGGNGRVAIVIKCPSCDSRNVLYRKRDKVFWCRKCGTHFRVLRKGGIKKVNVQ